jgi:hypothetical protein
MIGNTACKAGQWLQYVKAEKLLRQEQQKHIELYEKFTLVSTQDYPHKNLKS